jgi:hypothetical protein
MEPICPAALEPGEHHFSVMGQLPLWKDLSLNQLTAKPGETHYFFVHMVSGGGHDELTLTEVRPHKGKQLVAGGLFPISTRAAAQVAIETGLQQLSELRLR